MKIYYFAEEVNTNNMFYSTGESEHFETKEALLSSARAFFGEDAKKVLTKKVVESIVCKDIPDYDFYSVQMLVDGFGHDTATMAIFKTKDECYKYLKKKKKIYGGHMTMIINGQYWGEYEEEWG